MYRWWLVLLVGCYRPAEITSCDKLCGEAPGYVCPPGQTCDGNGRCKPDDMQGDCPLDAGVTTDAFEKVDAPQDSTKSGQTCFGANTDFFRVCVDDPMNDETVTNDLEINTNQCVQYQPQSAPPMVCVKAFRTLTINAGATMRAIGARPLAIVVTGALTINGTIDVASHVGGLQGANGNVTDCDPAAPGAQSVSGSGGGGGGAGGGLASRGGGGGTGAGGSTGGIETPPIAPAKLLRVRGGCPGADGGKAIGGAGGVDGAGGGAIYLMSNTVIAMGPSGFLNASGAGGGAPGDRGGGGGGGSGGFIGFHAPMYMFMTGSRIIAIGGAGASGGGPTDPGKNGLEATTTADTGNTTGVDGSGFGGSGAIGKGVGGGAGDPNTGGGGGGGSGGVIGFEGPVPSLSTGDFAPTPRAL